MLHPKKKGGVQMKTVARLGCWTDDVARNYRLPMFVILPHQTALISNNVTDSHTKHTKTLCYPLSGTKRRQFLNTVINYTMADIFYNMANNAYPCITYEQTAVNT